MTSHVPDLTLYRETRIWQAVARIVHPVERVHWAHTRGEDRRPTQVIVREVLPDVVAALDACPASIRREVRARVVAHLLSLPAKNNAPGAEAPGAFNRSRTVKPP